jgi:small subunit ribosomal protein S27Ae
MKRKNRYLEDINMAKKDLYTVEGDKIVRKNPFCPRCSEGVFMADHGDRYACGKCGYTEMKNKD